MNANELADELSWSEMDTDEIETWTKEAVTMLRQQQEKINKYELRNEEQRNRIAHLEAKLSEALDAENDRRFE
jgi:DNA-directed RNA polymerase beta' subunit